MEMEKIKKLCEKYNIILLSKAEIDSDSLSKLKGIALNVDGIKGIVYDDSMSKAQTAFVVAHELGHIILNHLNLRQKLMNEPAEAEADIFSAVFMASLLAKECAEI